MATATVKNMSLGDLSALKPVALEQPQQLLTPSATHSSRSPSPEPDTASTPTMLAKKKKKKKPKKKAASALITANGTAIPKPAPIPMLYISRNKHWKYISSYHGPWLQLPLEILESLLVINTDPATLSTSTPLHALPAPSTRQYKALPSPSYSHSRSSLLHSSRSRSFQATGETTPPDSPESGWAALTSPQAPEGIRTLPPSVDPSIFRSVATIRRLVDEAAELAVRATSGVSAAQLRASGGSGRDSLGHGGPGEGGGRNAAMSPQRIHRLRVLAVQKLALAYKADEVAASVMVMQGGNVFNDIAERVLRVDPDDVDARYVHFFHEKIPSRHLAASTTTELLTSLIKQQPFRLEFYRTRGFIHAVREEFAWATKDFTHAIKESRAQRRAKHTHRTAIHQHPAPSSSKTKKKGKSSKLPSPASTLMGDDDNNDAYIHPSAGLDAPDPLEAQCIFLRGSTHLAHAVALIERAVLQVEQVPRDVALAAIPPGGELRLSRLPETARFGGVEMSGRNGPLGARDGAKRAAYRSALAAPTFRARVCSLVGRALRDTERFLALFDAVTGPAHDPPSTLSQQIALAFGVFCDAGANVPGSGGLRVPLKDAPRIINVFTTYHPLLVEAHATALLCHLLLGSFSVLVEVLPRTAGAIAGTDGYPVFLVPRSMAHGEFVEVIERIAGCWIEGICVREGEGAGKMKVRSIHPVPPPVVRTFSVETDTDLETSFVGLSVNGSQPGPSARGSPEPSTSVADSRCTSPEPGAYTTAEAEDEAERIERLRDELDCARLILAPAARRRRDRLTAERARQAAQGGKPSVNIPLHGPRVDVILAWLGAVWLHELEEVA